MRFQIRLCAGLIVSSVVLTLVCQSKLFALISIATVLAMSLVGYLCTVRMIPVMKQYMLKKNICGLDMNKKGTEAGEKKIPESQGLVSATIFILISFASILVFKLFLSEEHLTEKFAALVCIVFSVLLGFVDDVLDIPWRYKLVLPLFGVLPVLLAYNGVTYVLLPNCVRQLLGTTLNIGVLYYIYMALLGIFCTNSINIYAGINGLEVGNSVGYIGQSIIIACSIIIHNSIEMALHPNNEGIQDTHMFSVLLLLPYVAVAMGLFKFNAYPSQVFVGDTFCYFSGVVFAVTGILGHFSKTLLLMFIPQVINFLYSLPQLIGFVPCPRHRLPKYNPQTQKLQGIKSNMNLVNLMLVIRGPMTEQHLCNQLLVLQCVCSGIGLFMRYLASKVLWT